MHKFWDDFEEFCKSEYEGSGKASSYVRAIQYLCEYMEIYEINADSINKIKLVEEKIKDKNSAFYQNLLEFLSERGKSSYLKGGFIRAALVYLFSFIKNKI